MAGTSDVPLRGIDNPDWSPTVASLRAILKAMDGPQGKLVAAACRMDSLCGDTLPFRAPDGRVLERLLKPEALAVFGQDGLSAAYDRLQAGDLSIDRAMVEAKSLVQGGAVHLVDASAEDPRRYRFRHWDNSTGYREGVDFTGAELGDVEDAAYLAELVAAYRSVRTSGRARVSFLHRRGADGMRTFYRILVPFIGHGGSPQVISVTLPEAPQAARHLFPSGMRV